MPALPDYDRIADHFFIDRRSYENSFSMPRNHYHNTFELFYLLDGERYYFIGDSTYHIMKGDLVLIDVDELHRTAHSGSAPAERWLINFHPAYIEPLARELHDVDLYSCFRRKIHVIRLSVGEQIGVETLFSRIQEEAEGRQAGHESMVKILLIELLLYVERIARKTAVSMDEPPAFIHKKISEVIAYINQNYTEHITLNDLSRQCEISLYYLSRLFKKATGFTITEYVNAVRVRAAQKLLTETDVKVAEIAAQTGFESITHFGRTFKAAVGLSPLAYRKRAAGFKV